MNKKNYFNLLDINSLPYKTKIVKGLKDEFIYQYAILNAILENSPLAVWAVDMNDNIIFVNSKILKELNITSPDEIRNDILEEMKKSKDFVVRSNEILQYSKAFVIDKEEINLDIFKVRLSAPDERLIGMLGIAVYSKEDKEMKEKIEYLSLHDSLTGLYNRGYFEMMIKELNKKENLPISLLVGDVNGLKLTNDAFGHEEGDRILKAISRVLKSSSRDDDIVARLGGDEFAIILPKTNEKERDIVEERIQAKIKTLKNFKVKPSISFGGITKDVLAGNLMKEFSKAEDKMYKAKLLEGIKLKDTILETLQESLAIAHQDNKSKEFVDMKQLIKKLGTKLKLSKEQINSLILLSDYKDIGKLSIPESLLEKKETLTEEDWKVLKKHPEVGYRIAIATKGLSYIAEDILYHHEHYDGNGYPRGLKGEEIPLNARVMSLVDGFYAMISERPYRKRMTFEEALETIRKEKGKKYDPQIVEIFEEVEQQILQKKTLG